MKHLGIGILILVLNLFGCHQAKKQLSSKKTNDSRSKNMPALQNNKSDLGDNKSDLVDNKSDLVIDKKEIQLLIGNVLLWAESKKAPGLTPVITDSKDSLCIGFDDEKIKANLEIFKSTGYFSVEFIDNYGQILQTLEKEMKDKKFAPWFTNELPPFNFANDVDPWSDCQDVPYDTPNVYNLVEVHVVSLNKEQGELYWTWGGLKPDTDPSWKEFKYKFRVKKEDNRWKISYLEGFDFKESVKYVNG
ncbi:MAG: hypothetical protein ACHQF4_04885 [Sphingobacteriales bacterium]